MGGPAHSRTNWGARAGQTHRRSHPVLCVYLVPWWPPNPLHGQVHLQSCNALRSPAHPWDQSAPWAAPSTCNKAGGTEGGCKEKGLGMPKGLDRFLSDLEVHFQPTSDGQNVLLVLQLASFRDLSSSQVRCPCSAPVARCQALLKSGPGGPTRAAWQGFHVVSSGLSRSLPLETPPFSPWHTQAPI